MSQNMTIVGNLAADPELRFTPNGKAVVEIGVMTSRSRKNEQTGQWENEDVTRWTVKAWDRLAENMAETLQKGDGVVVVGTAAHRSWENKDGSKGGRIEVTAWNVGFDLKRCSASPNRVKRDAAPQAAAVVEVDPWQTLPEGDGPPPF